MQIERLINIIIILLNKKKVTAKELANEFNVSTRTIYRDIETLSLAHVPVFSSRGNKGGISILEEYTLEKTFFTKEEQAELVFALKSLKLTNFKSIDSGINKLGSLFKNTEVNNWIEIDFSGWEENPGENEKFLLFKKGILNRQIVNFEYFSAKGEITKRQVEPKKLIYKGQSWYLEGFCLLRNAMRIFKITRSKNIVLENIVFQKNNSNMPFMENFNNTKDENIVNITLNFSLESAYRVYDEFHQENIIKTDNGFIVKLSMHFDGWIIGYILSFGSNVKVIEPEFIKNIIIESAKNIIKNYKN